MNTNIDTYRPRVLVLGDGMLDIWHIGTSFRQSAEAPIPIVKIIDTRQEPGGAGNVLMNLLTLGCDALRGYGDGPVKHRLVLEGRQIARWDEHDYCTPALCDFEPSAIDAVVVSDYGKGGLDMELLPFFQVPIFIDSKRNPRDFSGLKQELFFFPNEYEYCTYPESYRALEHQQGRHVIHKRGALGLRYGKHVFAARCAKPASVCGAGDTVIAAFARSYLQSPEILKSMEYANAAAAVVVAKPYTSTVTHAEVLDMLAGQPDIF